MDFKTILSFKSKYPEKKISLGLESGKQLIISTFFEKYKYSQQNPNFIQGRFIRGLERYNLYEYIIVFDLNVLTKETFF